MQVNTANSSLPRKIILRLHLVVSSLIILLTLLGLSAYTYLNGFEAIESGAFVWLGLGTIGIILLGHLTMMGLCFTHNRLQWIWTPFLLLPLSSFVYAVRFRYQIKWVAATTIFAHLLVIPLLGLALLPPDARTAALDKEYQDAVRKYGGEQVKRQIDEPFVLDRKTFNEILRRRAGRQFTGAE